MRRFWQRITQKRHGFIKQGFSMVVHIQRQKRFALRLKKQDILDFLSFTHQRTKKEECKILTFLV